MSVINLSDVKLALRVIHTADDTLLQQLLDSAEDEALRITNRTQLPTLPLDYPPSYDSDSNLIPQDIPSSGDPIAPSVFTAVVALVKANYDAPPDQAAQYRKMAEIQLWPYRTNMGA